MRRRQLILLAVVGASALSACAPTGVGDPCEPEVEPEGGFDDTETYIETPSLQCRTRVCMVLHEIGFCTLRCTADADCNAEWYQQGPGQGGAEAASCDGEVEIGDPALLGTYCVPAYARIGGTAE